MSKRLGDRTGMRRIAAGAVVAAALLLSGCALHGLTRDQASAVNPPAGATAQSEPSATPVIQHATQATFDEMVLRWPTPVLVDFYAPWCGPCRSMAPVLESLAKENPGMRIVKVDIQQCPELAARYNVRTIPNLVVFRNGQVEQQHAGLASKDAVKAMVRS